MTEKKKLTIWLQPEQLGGAVIKLVLWLNGLVGWLNGDVVVFEDIVGKPDGVEDIGLVELDKPVV